MRSVRIQHCRPDTPIDDEHVSDSVSASLPSGGGGGPRVASRLRARSVERSVSGAAGRRGTCPEATDVIQEAQRSIIVQCGTAGKETSGV